MQNAIDSIIIKRSRENKLELSIGDNKYASYMMQVFIEFKILIH